MTNLKEKIWKKYSNWIEKGIREKYIYEKNETSRDKRISERKLHILNINSFSTYQWRGLCSVTVWFCFNSNTADKVVTWGAA